MRSRLVPAVGVGIAALALATTFASGANASGSHITMTHQSTTHLVTMHPLNACYAQLDNDNGVGIVSQHFEPSFNIYNSRGADDFTLQSACSVQSVDAPGTYFNGTGPAAKVQVIFYQDDNGTPGAPIAKRGVLEANLTDNFGSFHVPFASPVNLDPGTYWISVRIRMDFSTGGEWGWNTNNAQRGDAAVWKNHGDGFATGCLVYGNMQTCLGAQGQGPDYTFSVNDSQ